MTTRNQHAPSRACGRLPKTVLALTALFALPGNYCGEVLEDPSFELWCEDRLCAWQLESGEIEKVPTWHRRDFGVSLVGDPAAISQLSTRTGAELDCLHFHLLADIEESAQVTLELDFYDDGVIDFHQIIPTSDWALLSYLITLPLEYQGIRFRLRKEGPGRAVLAEISAASSDQCTSAPIAIASRPAGADCTEPDQCAGGVCKSGSVPDLGMVCGECTFDSDCGSGACGLDAAVPVFLAPYRTCASAGHHGLGEICISDAECATGVCCGGACSTCCDNAAVYCPGGADCRERDPGDQPEWNPRPHQCDPRGGTAPAGTACLSGSDCQSGDCVGGADLRLCSRDGRVCAEDADCPPDLFDFFAETGYCVTVGVEGGSCR